jgi:hypothetical protein
VSAFLKNAEEIFATASQARGEDCSFAILIGANGGIQITGGEGWNLESLRLDRGADTAFLVTRENGRVNLEARGNGRHCTLSEETPAAVLRPALPECPVTMRAWLSAPTPQIY